MIGSRAEMAGEPGVMRDSLCTRRQSEVMDGARRRMDKELPRSPDNDANAQVSTESHVKMTRKNATRVHLGSRKLCARR